MVGVPRLELGTSSLSETRSNQLSYTPVKCERWEAKIRNSYLRLSPLNVGSFLKMERVMGLPLRGHPRPKAKLLAFYLAPLDTSRSSLERLDFFKWSGWWDSNPQQSAWKAGTLAIELHPQNSICVERLRMIWKVALVSKFFYHFFRPIATRARYPLFEEKSR